MSVNPTKSIVNVAPVANRELLNTQQKNQASQATSAKTPDGASASTNVSLSPAASTLLALHTHDVDMDKVERIKQAIAAGALTIDVQKIADALIRESVQGAEK